MSIYKTTDPTHPDDKVKVSPFIYRPELSIIQEKEKIAGKRTIDTMYHEGVLSEREILIMQFLRKYGSMTAHQIECAFAAPDVPDSMQKISFHEGNPYAKEISDLSMRGIIVASRICFNEKPLIRIYSISRHASEWMAAAFPPEQRTSRVIAPVKNMSEVPVLRVLDHLASVTFHLSELKASHSILKSSQMDYTDGANIFDCRYDYHGGMSVLLMAIRSPEQECRKAVNAISAGILRNRMMRILYLLPDLEKARNLRQMLQKLSDYNDEQVLYTTDLQAHEADGAPILYRLNNDGMEALLPVQH